jgi:hypothetical protein
MAWGSPSEPCTASSAVRALPLAGAEVHDLAAGRAGHEGGRADRRAGLGPAPTAGPLVHGQGGQHLRWHQAGVAFLPSRDVHGGDRLGVLGPGAPDAGVGSGDDHRHSPSKRRPEVRV